MHTPLIIANWKMKLMPHESAPIARKIVKAAARFSGAEVVLCPSFAQIPSIALITRNTSVSLGAQNLSWEQKGALTGEVSPLELKELGVSHVIIGHSERRQQLGESDEMVCKKVRAALSLGLVPILCIGETFDERQKGNKEVVLIQQLTAALKGVWFEKNTRFVVAYEPVWAIGSGQAVSDEEASHTHHVIKQTLYDLLPDTIVNQQIRITYGGSVNPENIAGFIKHKTIDGVLVGTDSLDPIKFNAIIAAAQRTAERFKP